MNKEYDGAKCQYCTHWHRIKDKHRHREKVGNNYYYTRKCGEANKTVDSATDACEFFEVHKSFYCDQFLGWVPVLGCINRQIKGMCNCEQGDLVCDLTAGIDPIDLGGKPRPVIIKRKAEVTVLNRHRPKLIKRKAS